jgi:O-antigen/teichoic acid export membrane protein
VQAGCVFAVVFDTGLLGVASSYVVGAAVSLSAGGFSFIRQVGPLRRVRLSLAHFRHVDNSWTYFFQTMVLTVRQRIDVVLVNNFLGAHAAGIYGSSQALVQRIDLLQDSATTALFPRVTDLHGSSPEELKALVSGSFKVLMVLSTPMAVGLFGVSSDVVLLIFGEKYLESSAVLAVLALGIPFSFTYGLMFNVLTAMGHQRTVFHCSLASSIVALAFLVGALATAGIAGASVAYVFSLASLAIPLVVIYWRRMGSMISTRDMLGLVAANAVMGVVLWLIGDLHLAAKILISAVVFALAVRVLGVMTLEMVRSALRRPRAAD